MIWSTGEQRAIDRLGEQIREARDCIERAERQLDRLLGALHAPTEGRSGEHDGLGETELSGALSRDRA